MNIDKDIEHLKNKISKVNRKHTHEEILRNIEAIEHIISELETYKKIAEKLAKKIQTEIYRNIDKPKDEICVENEGSNICKEHYYCIDCIIEWARNEVKKDG